MDGQQTAIKSSVLESPGGLVWVRRRNGSWWPGRIVELEELPLKCQFSRRLGTPIKLLGREDGSMDWYNLERTTRVKPFRCGEYDECIESVKAAFATRSRKNTGTMGKYVRREDAILHALDLERACFSTGEPSGSGISNSFHATTSSSESRKIVEVGSLHKQPGCISRSLSTEENTAKYLSQSTTLIEQSFKMAATNPEILPQKKWRTPNDSEDDEGTKRMRDLQEIGINMTSNRKHHMGVQPRCTDDLTRLDCGSLSGSKIANSFSNISQATNNKDSRLSMKRKKTNVAQTPENIRRKDRRRLLTKVCEDTRVVILSGCHWDDSFAKKSLGATSNTTKASISSSRGADLSAVTSNSSDCLETSSEETILDACEVTCGADDNNFDSAVKRSKFSGMLEFIDDFSDGLVNIPLVVNENIGRDSSMHQHWATEKQNDCNQDLVSQYSEGPSGSSRSECTVQINQQQPKNDGFRQYPDKRSMNHLTSSSEIADCSENGADECKIKDRRCNDRLFSGVNASDESLTSDYHGQMVKNELISGPSVPQTRAQLTMPPNTQEHDQAQVAMKFHSALSRTRLQERLLAINVPTSRPTLRSCSRYQRFQQPNERVGSPLYDVLVSVQSSYRGPHVPLVSLVSRLNGKAIVGHPVSVEVLITDACDPLVTRRRCQRGRRKISLSLRKGVKSTRLPTKKVSVRKYLKTGNYSRSKRPFMKQKISSKKKTGISPRKIRSLSSINVDRKGKEEETKPFVEKIVGPAVTCIPLRLVFSRITEALSCPTRSACGS